MADPATHALSIGTFALWLSAAAAGLTGIFVVDRKVETVIQDGGAAMNDGPVFILGESATADAKAAAEGEIPAAREPAEALPAPPQMPAAFTAAALPDVPDFPVRPRPAATGAAGAIAARLAAGTTPGPEYPPYSKRNGQTGTAVVQFTITASGRVTNASIYSSSGWNLLDRVALGTVESWNFPPGETMRLIRPIAFKLP